MEILFNIWLAFNIVFGFFTLKNYSLYFYSRFTRNRYSQNDLGLFIDRFVLVSIVAYYFCT